MDNQTPKLKNYLSQFLTISFFIYLVVGFSTFGLDITLFWVLNNLFKIWYLAAQAMTGVVVFFFNFLSHRRFTFNSNGRKRAQLPRYLGLAIFNYLVGLVGIYIFVEIIHLTPLVGKVLTVAVIVSYNFLALKKLVFRAG